jgi:hypothetical protein
MAAPSYKDLFIWDPFKLVWYIASSTYYFVKHSIFKIPEKQITVEEICEMYGITVEEYNKRRERYMEKAKNRYYSSKGKKWRRFKKRQPIKRSNETVNNIFIILLLVMCLSYFFK